MLRKLNDQCGAILDFSLKTSKCYSLIAWKCISAQSFWTRSDMYLDGIRFFIQVNYWIIIVSHGLQPFSEIHLPEWSTFDTLSCGQ